MNGISAVITETPESSLTPSTMGGCSQKRRWAMSEPGSQHSPDTESASAVILDFPDSRTVRSHFFLFINHRVYNIFMAV